MECRADPSPGLRLRAGKDPPPKRPASSRPAALAGFSPEFRVPPRTLPACPLSPLSFFLCLLSSFSASSPAPPSRPAHCLDQDPWGATLSLALLPPPRPPGGDSSRQSLRSPCAGGGTGMESQPGPGALIQQALCLASRPRAPGPASPASAVGPCVQPAPPPWPLWPDPLSFLETQRELGT